MSAQVEEVTASAQSLAELAGALQQVVAQFNLGAQPELTEAVRSRDGDSRMGAPGPRPLASAGSPEPAPAYAPAYVGPDRRAALAERVRTGAESGNGKTAKVRS
jgi:hypothetical protein